MDKETIELIRWILQLIILPLSIWLVKIYSTVGVIQNDVKWIKESFAVTGKKSVRTLHSPHTPELDALLEKYEHEQITYDEVQKLIAILEHVEANERTPLDKKEAATRLLGSIVVRYQILAK